MVWPHPETALNMSRHDRNAAMRAIPAAISFRRPVSMLLLRFYFSMGMNAEAAGSRTVSGVFASSQ
ncbi:hypothetical protein BG46_01040 [Brucella anthropi]|nr:hypothetical protein BG46_01040 [Brucella anthropi]